MSGINLPSFSNMQVVDKDGKFTSNALTMFDQLFTQLAANFSQGGLVLPPSMQQTDEKLAKTGNGSMLYDGASHAPKINIDGVIKTIQTA